MLIIIGNIILEIYTEAQNSFSLMKHQALLFAVILPSNHAKDYAALHQSIHGPTVAQVPQLSEPQ